MTEQQIFAVLANVKKGRYVKIRKKKDLGEGVVRETEVLVRLGVQYSNLQMNAGKQIEPLRYGAWVPGYENLVLEHKGKYYLRVTAIDPEHKSGKTAVVDYEYTGNTDPAAIARALAAEKQSAPSPVYNIKFENILGIGSEVTENA